MDVILTKSVESLGQMGEVISVAPGFARNYLIPQRLAVMATEGQKKLVAEQVVLAQKRELLRKSAAEQLASQYAAKELSCTINVQADDDDKLFGSVTARDIATALAQQDLTIEHHQIELTEPIKQLGVYTVALKLHSDVEVAAKVWVVKA